jgi:hypothetical protein
MYKYIFFAGNLATSFFEMILTFFGGFSSVRQVPDDFVRPHSWRTDVVKKEDKIAK